jgi:hypothetical protein
MVRAQHFQKEFYEATKNPVPGRKPAGQRGSHG